MDILNSLCAIIVGLALFLGLPISIIWLIIRLFKKKSIKPLIMSACSCIGVTIIFSILGSAIWSRTDDYQEYLVDKQTEQESIEQAKLESAEQSTMELAEKEQKKNAEIVNKPTTEESVTETLPIETKNHETISIKNEDEFKLSCVEVVYNDIDKEWIGKYVTKEILFTSTEQAEYQCASTESYVEEYSDYQHVYAIYDIFDCRFDKSFPIYSNDVIRIYGIVTDVEMNYANGLYYPIIDMYYADYIREWRKPISENKSIDELIQERNAEKERIRAENEYYDSLNSDYTGTTKNVDDMESLNEAEFKTNCDSMNFKNMVDATEDLTGRYVKIHLQLTSHKVFTSEEAKRNRLDNLVDMYSINNNVWYSRLFYERTEKYIGEPILLYFADNSSYNLDTLKKDQELIVYGIVLNYTINEGFHNEFDFLAVYIE